MASVRRLLRKAIRKQNDEASTGELNIVPFLDIVTNLMLFLLATTTFVASVSEVRADLPGYGPGHPSLDLSVTLTDRGAIMASSLGRIGPDCMVSASPAPTAARTTDGYDFAALARCAVAMHAAAPAESSVVISADPGVPYGDLVRGMDALRSDGDRMLFPDVRISAGVR